MKKNNKKGFTIVELVIVIAVIAILSGVLVGVFTNVVASSKRSAAMQEMQGEWTHYLAEKATNAAGNDKSYIAIYEKDGSYYAMAIVKGMNASDYVTEESEDITSVLTRLNEALDGETVNGVTFNHTNASNAYQRILPEGYDPNNFNCKDITEGITGCSDHVAIYAARIGA